MKGYKAFNLSHHTWMLMGPSSRYIYPKRMYSGKPSKIEKRLIACRSGWHFVTSPYDSLWLYDGDVKMEIEAMGEIKKCRCKYLCQQFRMVRVVSYHDGDQWTRKKSEWPESLREIDKSLREAR